MIAMLNWMREAIARADSLAMIEAKLDAMASILGEIFVAIRRRLDNLEKHMSPEQEQLITEVRALIVALPAPAALREAQATVAMLTANRIAAKEDNYKLLKIVAEKTADALQLAKDNDRLEADLQAIKERLTPAQDIPQSAPA
jgi:hypothetical protein